VIERLLAAERALAEGRLDHAEQLFGQVAEADERNAIAVVGLAEVALARGDAPEAMALARRALEIDPDEAAAARLLASVPTAPAAPPTGPAAAVAAPRPTLAGRIRAWLRRLVGRTG
jgi:thioredoxin-like negative regulator of GroEL